MKKVLLVFALLLSLAASAQDAAENISIEVFGAQTTVGVNYDTRLKGNDGLGYRVGIGYAYGHNNWQTVEGVGIPLEVNYLLGKKKSKLELGFGVNVGYYSVEEEVPYYNIYTVTDNEGHETQLAYLAGYYMEKNSMFGYYFFGNIGYRYQPASGVMFRIGISPSFNFDDCHSVYKKAFYPYFGLGWTF